ncbi:MAG: hypothetical protein KDJ19_12415 [Hyphomicrobiaceae bacterium]|nr:hypothetical protein [Hyphomicrobiaceae bacterium]MCC0022747.1 hypothetical protein [Hyphomicrobiaceae bacterium]
MNAPTIPDTQQEGSRRKSILTTILMARHLFLRWDWRVILFFVLAGTYSVFFLGSFAFLAMGLRDALGAAGADSTTISRLGITIPLDGVVDPITIGLVLLGLSAVLSFLSTLLGRATAAQFATEIVMRFADRWDELRPAQRTAIFATAAATAMFSRLLLVAAIPTYAFIFGVGALSLFSPWLGLGLLVLGALGLAAYIRFGELATLTTHAEFDRDISADTLRSSQKRLRGFMAHKLEDYVYRRIASAFLVVTLFAAIALSVYTFGVTNIVNTFGEHIIYILVLFRMSMLSLSRLAICFRMARKRHKALDNALGAIRQGALPVPVSGKVIDDLLDDDDDM